MIVNTLSSRKFNRYKVNRVQIAQYIQKFSGKPIKIIGYWGVMGKKNMDSLDQETFAFLMDLGNKIKKMYSPGVKFIFLISDTRADTNGYTNYEQYVLDLKKLFTKHNVTWYMLSSFSFPFVKTTISGKFQNKLLAGAKKHYKGNPEEGVKQYVNLRYSEARFIERIC